MPIRKLAGRWPWNALIIYPDRGDPGRHAARSRDEGPWTLARHVMLAGVLLAWFVACRVATTRGALGALADSVGAVRNERECGPTMEPRYGASAGCLTSRGDTTAYTFSRNSGEVVVVGREWPVADTALQSAFDALRRTIEAQFGGGQTCLHDDLDWQVRDQRWRAKGYHVALLSMRPPQGFSSGPSVRLVYALGEPSCRDWLAVPRR